MIDSDYDAERALALTPAERVRIANEIATLLNVPCVGPQVSKLHLEFLGLMDDVWDSECSSQETKLSFGIGLQMMLIFPSNVLMPVSRPYGSFLLWIEQCYEKHPLLSGKQLCRHGDRTVVA